MTTPDRLNDAIVNHQTYLWTDRCLEEAWDEARDQMPDHLTGPILAWFQSTYRFSTCLEDWLLENTVTPLDEDG